VFSWHGARIAPQYTGCAGPAPISVAVACRPARLCLVAFAFLHGSLWEVFVVITVAGYGVGALYAATPGFIVRSVRPHSAYVSGNEPAPAE
jgi:hypothetical protein